MLSIYLFLGLFSHLMKPCLILRHWWFEHCQSRRTVNSRAEKVKGTWIVQLLVWALSEPGSTRKHFTHILVLTNFTLLCISAKDVFWIVMEVTLGQFQSMCPYKTTWKWKNIFLLCWWCPFLPNSDIFGVLWGFRSFWIVGKYVQISQFSKSIWLKSEILKKNRAECWIWFFGCFFLMIGWFGLGFY